MTAMALAARAPDTLVEGFAALKDNALRTFNSKRKSSFDDIDVSDCVRKLSCLFAAENSR